MGEALHTHEPLSDRAKHILQHLTDTILGGIVNKLRDAEIEELKYNDRSQEDNTGPN